MRVNRHLFLIPVAALLAIWPLVLHGSSCGDDFGFHLMNWLNVHSQWQQGILYPQWDFTAAWNSGAPRFVFYPPLSWTVGALLGSILPWKVVPDVFIWLALTASGFTMYRLAGEWVDTGSAMIAACFYMVHPYMMFTYYERSAFAELLAAAWIPLIVLAIMRRRISILGIAIPVALLWLTDDPAAVMGCYLLTVLAVARILWIYITSRCSRKALCEAGHILLGICTGLALASFYLVPAIVEQQWVHITMAEIPGVRVQDNFLFGQFGGADHRAILRSASLASITLLALIVVFSSAVILRRNPESTEPERGYRYFLVVAVLSSSALIGFLLTEPSLVVWRHVPELKYLQFPWRLDALLGTIAAMMLALMLARIRLQSLVAIAVSLAIPFTLSSGGNSWYRQYCNPGYSASDVVAAFNSGDPRDPTDEYPPATSDPTVVGHNNPRAWIVGAPSGPPQQIVSTTYSTFVSDRLRFRVQSRSPAFLVANVRNYPAWKVTVNGIPTSRRPHRHDGLLVVPIPQGVSTIRITYSLTLDRIAGCILTTSCLIVLLVVWCRYRFRRQ